MNAGCTSSKLTTRLQSAAVVRGDGPVDGLRGRRFTVHSIIGQLFSERMHISRAYDAIYAASRAISAAVLFGIGRPSEEERNDRA